MSKEQGKDRTAQEHGGAGHEESRPERPLSKKGSTEVLGKHGGPAITQPQHHKPPKPAAKSQPKATGPGKGRPTPKQQAQKQAQKQARKQTRPAKGRSRPGRPDGPLARRRRLRIRLLAALWVVVNVAAWFVWRDWEVSLAVFVLSVLITPLLGALLLRRR